jgi:hypothetical protein
MKVVQMRKLTIAIEMESKEKLALLRDKKMWQHILGDLLGKVLQVQANVIAPVVAKAKAKPAAAKAKGCARR